MAKVGYVEIFIQINDTKGQYHVKNTVSKKDAILFIETNAK